MALFASGSVPPYPSQEAAQAAADHVDQAGGWHEPDPPVLGRSLTRPPMTTSPTAPTGSHQATKMRQAGSDATAPGLSHLREDP
jgi:hypothetical protein